MDNSINRFWNVLYWNVRGTNDPKKWVLIRDKIERAIVLSFVFKKQNVIILINPS